jgi:hypothetical protein
MYMRIISDESLKLYVIGYNLLEIDWGLFRCFKALVPGRFQSTSASSTEGRWCLMIFSTFSRGAGDDIARDTTGRVFFSHFGAQKIMEETPPCDAGGYRRAAICPGAGFQTRVRRALARCGESVQAMVVGGQVSAGQKHRAIAKQGERAFCSKQAGRRQLQPRYHGHHSHRLAGPSIRHVHYQRDGL